MCGYAGSDNSDVNFVSIGLLSDINYNIYQVEISLFFAVPSIFFLRLFSQILVLRVETCF